MLSVATDRVSVFDVVLENGIPGKGIMLTTLSSFWFDYFGEQFNHHLVSTDVDDVPGLTEMSAICYVVGLCCAARRGFTG